MNCKPIGMFALLLLVVLGVGNAALVWHTHTEVDRRLERIDSAHAQTANRLDLAQERLDQLAKQIKGIDEQVVSLQKQADAASHVTDRLDASFASLEKKMDQSFARLALKAPVPEVIEPVKTPPVPQSVAVLPFAYVTQVKDRTPDFVLNYLASSLASGLLKKRLPVTPLSVLAGHKKGGTEGREEYAGRNAQQAGQRLGVEFVLAGIVTEGSGWDLLLHVELLRSDSGVLVWTGRYALSQKSEEFERTATRIIEQIIPEVAEKIAGKKVP